VPLTRLEVSLHADTYTITHLPLHYMKNFFALVLFLVPFIVICQTISGKVVRVADGDTVTLLDSTNKQIRIRLYGIDCPESKQDFGQVAKKFTSDLCFGQYIKVEVRDIDRYGRTVGIIWAQDTVNVNFELLKAGLAWHYKQYDKSPAYAQAEEKARAKKIGLWKQPNAIAPWEFRKQKKKVAQENAKVTQKNKKTA